MSESIKLRSRNEILPEDTWAIEDLFLSDELWQEAYEKVSADLSRFADFEGTLHNSSEALFNCLTFNDTMEEALENVYVYARQKLDEDTTNSKYQDYASKAQSLAVKLNSASAFIVPEILSIEEQTLLKFMESGKLSLYRRFMEVLFRQKEHTLSGPLETLLAKSRDISQAPSQIFSMFNNADIDFPEIHDEDGRLVKLTQGRYIAFLESADRNVRKSAFQAMLGTYGRFKNTLAAAFQSNLKQAVFYADARNYPSTRAYYLSDSNVPEKVYDNLIDVVHKNLPLLHRYVALRKKLLGLEEIHMYDLYTPMVPDADKKISYDTAKEMIQEALKPLGTDYLSVLREGFDSRWIDVRENAGKRTGAYSWGAYGTHPYVLMNYNDTLNSTFTLAHEMGHAIHSYYSDKNQPYPYAGYKIFVAEVASTCNESLLIQDLIAKTEDEKERSFLINDFLEKFRGTLFRQTMFAEFEMLTHKMVENGETLTAESLCSLYHQLNETYFGKEIIIDSEIDMEWARIPHFYNPFYVYQYATGFSAAIALSRRILEEGEPAVNDYIKFLSGGSSMDPIALLKEAGVDMTSGTPIEEAMNLFESLLEQL